MCVCVCVRARALILIDVYIIDLMTWMETVQRRSDNSNKLRSKSLLAPSFSFTALYFSLFFSVNLHSFHILTFFSSHFFFLSFFLFFYFLLSLIVSMERHIREIAILAVARDDIRKVCRKVIVLVEFLLFLFVTATTIFIRLRSNHRKIINVT